MSFEKLFVGVLLLLSGQVHAFELPVDHYAPGDMQKFGTTHEVYQYIWLKPVSLEAGYWNENVGEGKTFQTVTRVSENQFVLKDEDGTSLMVATYERYFEHSPLVSLEIDGIVSKGKEKAQTFSGCALYNK